MPTNHSVMLSMVQEDTGRQSFLHIHRQSGHQLDCPIVVVTKQIDIVFMKEASLLGTQPTSFRLLFTFHNVLENGTFVLFDNHEQQ